jgi:hypothetical protein
MKKLRWISAICVLTLLLITAPRIGQAARRKSRARKSRVAVSVTAKQSKQTVATLRRLVRSELEKQGIKVHRLIPTRWSKSRRRLAIYARRHRVRRLYSLSLVPEGKGYRVMLTEKQGRRLRDVFTAKLTASSIVQIEPVLARLVAAVIKREPPRQPVLVAEVKPTTIASDAATPATPTATTAVAQPAEDPSPPASPGTEEKGQFLIGVSLEPGTFLTAAAPLYGGSGKLYYQKRSYRLGAEIQAMFGEGRLLNIAASGQYMFPLGSMPKITPLVGANLGYLMLTTQDNSEGNGIAFSASGGAEFSQLSWTRLVAEVEFVLPLFVAKRHDPDLNNGILDLKEHSAYSPAVVLKLSALF